MQADEEGVALLRGILDNPRDWIRLQVFSDFLLEQGLPGYLGWRLLALAERWPCEDLQARKYPWVWWNPMGIFVGPEFRPFTLPLEVWRRLRPARRRDWQAKYAGVLDALADLAGVLERNGPLSASFAARPGDAGVPDHVFRDGNG